jgi:class 3 adenylate cyclase
MGDAVLLSFIDPLDAIKAAILFQKKFNGTGPGNLITRITINRGPCLAVNLNNGIDYFGQTVNITAKLQNYAGGGEIVFTREFIQDDSAKEYLMQKGFKEKNVKTASIKGAGDIEYFSIKIMPKK